MAGFGIESRSLDDFPEQERVYNADRSRAAAYWIGRSHADRYDDDTIYEIGEWEVASKKKVGAYTRVHKVDNRTGNERGKPVTGVHYGDDAKLYIEFDDGTHEAAKIERKPLSKHTGKKLDFGQLGKKPINWPPKT